MLFFLASEDIKQKNRIDRTLKPDSELRSCVKVEVAVLGSHP